MSDAVTRLRTAAVERAVQGAGKASAVQRQAAFANAGVREPARALIDKVARNAWKVTDEDVAAVKQAGLAEDEIFELVVTAAYGQATRQLDAALGAVDQAFAATATKESA